MRSRPDADGAAPLVALLCRRDGRRGERGRTPTVRAAPKSRGHDANANMPPQPCLQMPTTPCGRKARTVGFGARFTYRRNAYGRVLRSHVLETVGRLPVGLSTHITIGSAISGPMLAYTPPADSAKHNGYSAAERPLHAALLAFVRAPVGTAVIGTAEMRR